jgi:hypothetical protein
MHDRILLNTLKRHYGTVYFWPQQSEDDSYFKSLAIDGVRLISPSLKAFDRVLQDEDCDFIGTRLHGGIRALQKGRRCLVIAIDNRATEISKDFELPVLAREMCGEVLNWIYGEAPTRVKLPLNAIAEWRRQFSGSGRESRQAERSSNTVAGSLACEFDNG